MAAAPNMFVFICVSRDNWLKDKIAYGANRQQIAAGIAGNWNWEGLRTTYDRLCQGLANMGGCQIVLDVAGQANLYHDRNTAQEYHAEEKFFEQAAGPVAAIEGGIISIEPCHGGRYPGHGCIDFFGPAGRVIPGGPGGALHGGAACHFVPNLPVTPVFFFEDQPAAGQNSYFWRLLRYAESKGRVVDYTRTFFGAQPAQFHFVGGVSPFEKKGHDYIVSGQKDLTPYEIALVIRNARKADPTLRIENWEQGGCSEDTREAVLDLLRD